MSAVKETTNILVGIQTRTISRVIPWAKHLTSIYAISAAVLTGVFILAAVGFAGPEVLHNAAHDIRHGLAFPCH